MLPDRYADLPDGPFARLRGLLDVLPAAANLSKIVLSIGEPHHALPEFVGPILQQHLKDFGKYPPIEGTAALKSAILRYLKRLYPSVGTLLDPDHHVLPLNGTREGLFLLPQVVTPRKKNHQRPCVLIPNPFYQTYAGAGLAAGAEVIYLDSLADNGFLPDLSAVNSDTWARTSMLILCSPSNPEGAIADRGYLKHALELARQFDFLLVIDECYAELYGPEKPVGGLEVAAMSGSLDNLVVIHSLSKRSNAPGLRSGFVCGDEKIIRDFVRLRQYGGPTTPLPIQAVSAALWNDDQHVIDNRQLYQQKFDLADQILGGFDGYYRPKGGFFLWLHTGNGEKTAQDLWTDWALRTLPGSYLARANEESANPGDAYVRIALVDDLATTSEALHRLASYLQRKS